jgi:outer membrane lipoprotein-sorting protein
MLFDERSTSPCIGRWLTLLSLSLTTVAAAAESSTTAPTTSPPEFVQRLRDINARGLKIKDLTADFVQEKRSPLLRKPLISRGRVAAKGDTSLWQTDVPEPTQMTCNPHLLRLYYPARKVVEEYPVTSRLGMLAASPLPSLDVILQNFTALPDAGDDLPAAAGALPDSVQPVAVRMNPVDDEVRRYLDHARVLLDPQRGLVLTFEMVDPDGERTLIQFSKVQTDVGLSDDAVNLHLPADVKIVHPLGERQPQQQQGR